jgi:hypothetical protein
LKNASLATLLHLLQIGISQMDINKNPTSAQELPSFRWEHPDKKRYYKLILSRDLLGDWVVTRVWGGLNQATGRISHIPCPTYNDAIKLMEKISKTRTNRGYVNAKQD